MFPGTRLVTDVGVGSPTLDVRTGPGHRGLEKAVESEPCSWPEETSVSGCNIIHFCVGAVLWFLTLSESDAVPILTEQITVLNFERPSGELNVTWRGN